jgi:broad specificity phosphatase PhoE
MLQVQVRVVAKLSEWAREFPDAKIAVFSHGDPIRSALMYYLAMPFDSVHRLQVSTGSISELELGPDWATVTGINHRPA